MNIQLIPQAEHAAINRFFEVSILAVKRRIHPRNLRVASYMEQETNSMVLSLVARVATQRVAEKTLEWPDGPWAAWLHWFYATKIGKAPLFRRLLGSPNMKRYTMKATAYHPDIAIPDHDSYVHIAINSPYERIL